MDSKKVLLKLEQDLTHFLISEVCKADPSKRLSGEMYKYRGLNISVDQNSKKQEKTIFVRIGVLEAEFKIGSNEKCSGGLSTEEEKLVKKWMSSGDTATKLQNVFAAKKITQKPLIIPFDLEYFYS